MTPRPTVLRPARTVGLAVAAALALACAACAHHPQGTNIDQRPTPAQPGPVTATPPGATPATDSTVVHHPPPPPGTKVETAGPARAAADTLAARRALNRCAGRNLLPEQESTIVSVTSLLRSAQAAMLNQDWTRAESLARQARQLAGSLGCP